VERFSVVRAETRGMAIPLVLFLLLALMVLAQGALILSRHERRASWAFQHAALAGKAAEAAVRLGLRAPTFPLENRERWIVHPTLVRETDDGLRFQAVTRWLDGEFFLLEGTGENRGWEGERRTGIVGWSLLPEARVGAFQAGVEMGGRLRLEGLGRMEMDGFSDLPSGWKEGDCSSQQAVLDSLFSKGVPDPVGSLPGSGAPPEPSPGSIPPLGLLGGSRLLELAGSEPIPVEGYFPGDSVRGCPGSGAPVFFGFRGSVVLTRGRVCGILVVEGDLRLGGEARFQGLALVGGDLVLEGASVFEGIARIGEEVRIADSGAFLGSGCPVLLALEGIPELQAPFLVDGTFLNGF